MVSIIIVHYKADKELFACVASIIKSTKNISYEIIVVDNDEISQIRRTLKIKFPVVRYIRSNINVGYGGGNNLGAKGAKGEYLFFLNPDTIVKSGAIENLYKFLVLNKNAGMIAPLLFNPAGKAYPSQGSDAYTLINGIVVLSIINKVFPNNPISSKFFHKGWNKKNIEEFDVVPGTAFMIKRNVFEKAGMFDEKMFLYFEEYDLANRVKKSGYKNYILPDSKVFHIWEASTKKRRDVKQIFSKSRYYFFKKNYGMLTALVVDLFARISKFELLLLPIIILFAFLCLFRINDLMVFIGDQAWFCISARDMIANEEVPLVGIPSSRPWLHQGPFWTYLLAFSLWLFNFHPVSGIFITLLFGLLSILGIYLLCSILFSKRVGLIASLLYATSPLVVFYTRFPYHTSVIPFFVIPFVFSLYKILQNKVRYIPFALFLLSVLYNFEIAAVVLSLILVGVLVLKILRKDISLEQILNKKIMFYSLLGVLIPLVPMILYDIKNEFPQTFKFVGWIFYRAYSAVDINSEHVFSIEKILIMLNFFQENFTKLIFPINNVVSIVILVMAIVGSAVALYGKKVTKGHVVIYVTFIVSLTTIVLNQTPSDAYLPILFPSAIILIAIFFDYLLKFKKFYQGVFLLVFILIFGNIYFLFTNNFSFDRYSSNFTLGKRIEASRKILDIAGNKQYNLIGEGPGSQYESFTMNYEYLTWWLGHGPSEKIEKIKITITESENSIQVK